MKKAVVKQVSSLITAAFGLVTALAWNSAIQEIFKYYFGEQTGIVAMVSYALIVTIIAVFASIWIGKLAGKTK